MKIIGVIFFIVVFGFNALPAEAGYQTNKLPNFDSSLQFNDLQGVEHSFAKAINYKKGSTTITALDILKFVYPNKTPEQLSTASASIKDCIRYAQSIGINMEWLDNESQAQVYSLAKNEIDKGIPVLVCFKPLEPEWFEPYLLGIAQSYMHIDANGESIKEPIESVSFWFYHIEKFIMQNQEHKDTVTISDPWNLGFVPDKEYRIIGSIIIK